MAELVDLLDLDLAWARTLWDMKEDRTFFVPPFLRQVIDDDDESWLGRIRERIAEDSYQPAALRILDVPKPRGAIRPGCVLSLKDHVVFSALVGVCRDEIQRTLDWGDPPPDLAYRFNEDTEAVPWFENYFHHWRNFDELSLDAIEAGAEWVVTADIAGYYEQIDLYLLRSDLSALDVERDAVSLLLRCLHRWSETEKRGVPQGHSPADILAKLYLNSVDRSLSAAGIQHLRWVDDFRLFTETRAEARRALLFLTQLLRARGLVVQSAKTRIVPSGEAMGHFQGVHAIVDPIRDEVEERIRDALGDAPPSIRTPALDRFLNQDEGRESIPVLEEAYRQYVMDEDFFNKTVFRFLLNRLGSANSEFAWDHAFQQLFERPEETTAVLEYAKRVGRIADAEAALVDFFHSPDSVYDYQIYQALKWRSELDGEPSEEFLRFTRQVVFEDDGPWYVKATARVILGRWGIAADLERLIAMYGDAANELHRVGIIAASMRVEQGRRNAFLGHAQGDGNLCAEATRLVRAGAIQWR